MAAGLGFKNFTSGSVLTAADVNGYLMQGVLVFASTAARDSAITSPQEGQFAYTKDTNGLWYYDGAAWVASGATGDIEGVTAGVGISGGGTSGTVTVTNSMATAIDAKGDLIGGTGADTFDRLAVGANDTVLTADSTAATGLKWAAPAGGGANWSLLNAGGTSLSSFATTISGISGKDKIMVLWSGTATQADFQLRLNADSGTNYNQFGGYISGGTGTVAESVINQASTSQTVITLAKTNTNSSPASTSGGITFTGCNSSGLKQFVLASGANFNSGFQNQRNYTSQGFYSGTSTISSITIQCNSGSFGGGTVWVYASA
jgi:hypothetical protein